MLESVFTPNNEVVWHDLSDTEEDRQTARDRALLFRATNLAIENAFSHSIDLPIGAVAARGDWIVGRYIASDHRLNRRQMHAEYMAIQDWQISRISFGAEAPNTLVVSVEPCDDCQDFIATIPSIDRVGFGLSRSEIEERGLVKKHHETIYERVERLRLPYRVFQIEEPPLLQTGRVILDFTRRNLQTEEVEIDRHGLHQALVELNAA